jgi:hypothetical protein
MHTIVNNSAQGSNLWAIHGGWLQTKALEHVDA